MSFPINRASLAAAIAALAGAVIAKDPGGGLSTPRPVRKAPTRIRQFRTRRSSAPQIKQGARECARRQGGQAWADFKAADRVRRGLSPYYGTARTVGEAYARLANWREDNPAIVAAWKTGAQQ